MGARNDSLIFGALPDTVCQSGDVRARVASLYEAHRDGIFRFLVAQGLGAAAAQDLAQDVFLDLFAALRKGTHIRAEQAWLYTVAARAAVDYWRHEKKPMWVELDSDEGLSETLACARPTPEHQAAENQRLRRIATGIRNLPKEHRLCIYLRMQGLRYREIAGVLGISTSTAAEWLSFAIERLRGEACD